MALLGVRAGLVSQLAAHASEPLSREVSPAVACSTPCSLVGRRKRPQQVKLNPVGKEKAQKQKNARKTEHDCFGVLEIQSLNGHQIKLNNTLHLCLCMYRCMGMCSCGCTCVHGCTYMYVCVWTQDQPLLSSFWGHPPT